MSAPRSAPSAVLIPSALDRASSTPPSPLLSLSASETHTPLDAAVIIPPSLPLSLHLTQPTDDQRSLSSSATHASHRPLTRLQRTSTAAVEHSSSASLIPNTIDPLVVVLSDADLASLSPSSTTPLASLLSSPTLPSWLVAVIREVGAGAHTRRRFSIAVALAVYGHLDATIGGESALARPTVELAAADSLSTLPLGRGVTTGAVSSLCKLFSLPLAPFTSSSSLAKLDTAVRLLLRMLASTSVGVERSEAVSLLGRLYDGALPPDCTATFASLHTSNPATAMPSSTPFTFPPYPLVVPAAEFALPPDVLSRSEAVPVAHSGSPLSVAPPHIDSVIVVPVTGENEQCFYFAVADALQIPGRQEASFDHRGAPLWHWDGIDSLLRRQLISISSASTLCAYGFDIAPDAGAAQVSLAKRNYLNSANFKQQRWGGTIEMFLLSRAYNGHLRFFVVDGTEEPAKSYCCYADQDALGPSLLPRAPPGCSPKSEIALHFCSYRGGSRAGNHYNALHYRLADGSVVKRWMYLADEQPGERSTREKHLIDASSTSAEITRAAFAANVNVNLPTVAPSIQATPDVTQSPQRHTRLPLRHSSSSASSTPLPASHTVGQSCSTYQPPIALADIWREIPTSCHAHWLAVSEAMFESYLKHSSSGDFVRCAEVLGMMLDLPSKTLLKGGRAPEIQHALTKQMAFWREHSASQVPPSLLPPSSLPALASSPSASPASLPSEAPSRASTVVLQSASSTSTTNRVEFTTADTPDESVDPLVKKIKRAVRIMQEGAPRAKTRAVRALLQAPHASVDEKTIAQLRALHPQSTQPLSHLPRNKALPLTAVEKSTVFKLLKQRVNNGSAPGPSGWTGSHLQLIADQGSDEAKDGIAMLVRDLCNGIFGGATQQRLLASLLMPITKNGGSGIRPIAMGEVFVKLAAHYSMSLIEKELPSLFPRIQFGVKRAGGSESAAQLTRALTVHSCSIHPDTIVLKTDIQNAFNSVSRAHVWKTLLSHPNTEPLWRMFHWSYATPSPLLVYSDRRLHTVLDSSEGLRQGDPFAAFGFSLDVQPMWEAAIDGLKDTHAVSVQDDLSIIGPQAQVFQAYDRLTRMVDQYHLTLRTDKCAVYIPPTLTHPTTLALLQSACDTCRLARFPYLESLGVVLGAADDIRTHTESTVDSHDLLFECLVHKSMPTQIALSLLRHCAVPRLGFLARTVHPTLLRPAASRFDTRVMASFRMLMQIGDDTHLPDVPLADVLTQATLPVKAGGFGLRPVERISPAAYFSSLASILPDFVRAFPPTVCSDYTLTGVHKELKEIRAMMVAQGVDARPTTIAPPTKSMTRKKPTDPPPMPLPRVTSTAASLAPRRVDIAVSTPASSTLHSTVDHLWQRAARHLTQPAAAPFLQAESIQSACTTQIEQKIYRQLHLRSTPYRRTLLTSVGAAHACDFLLARPTLSSYRISDEQLRLACRHRLGLLPYDHLHRHHCVCQGNVGPRFRDDPDHFHSCERYRRTLVTMRHNNIAQVVQDLATAVGFHCIREPNLHVRPTDVRDQSARSQKYHEHADLLLLKHDQKFYIDVTITRPTNATHLAQHRLVQNTPLHSTVGREKAKQKKYADIAEANEYQMVAFACETYGGIGRQASDLLTKLAAHSKQYTPMEFLRHAYDRLSVTLQASNADISQMGMQQLHLAQHASNRHAYFAKMHRRFTGGGYSEPRRDADRLAQRLQSTIDIDQAQSAGEASAYLQLAAAFEHDGRIAFADVAVDTDGVDSIAA